MYNILAGMIDCKFFSKADVTSGYWHVVLDEHSLILGLVCPKLYQLISQLINNTRYVVKRKV